MRSGTGVRMGAGVDAEMCSGAGLMGSDGIKSASDGYASQAELTLLGFAAYASLSPFERLYALDTTLTTGRLHRAAKALDRQRSRLAAMVALRRAEEARLSLSWWLWDSSPSPDADHDTQTDEA